MKKWIVRWVVKGFNVREEFDSYAKAKKYYDEIINTIEDIEEIDIWENK